MSESVTAALQGAHGRTSRKIRAPANGGYGHVQAAFGYILVGPAQAADEGWVAASSWVNDVLLIR